MFVLPSSVIACFSRSEATPVWFFMWQAMRPAIGMNQNLSLNLYGPVAVIGESCSDVYVYGSCRRMCPEAPVPIFVKESEHRNAGMAGNVVANLEALGMTTELCTQPEVITKTRLVEQSRNHMLVRIDDDAKITPFVALKSYPDFAGRVAVATSSPSGTRLS